MSAALRLFFLAFYCVSLAVFAAKVLPVAAAVHNPERRATDWRRHLPALLLPIGFVVPPLLLWLRWGELDAGWPAVRLAGVGLAAYAAPMLLASAATMGPRLVPQAVVMADHVLVTRGPYRLVRHPAYSGDLALFLGAALATLDVALLALWPLYAAGVMAQVRMEEELLAAKFGVAHREYVARTGRLVPRLTA
jgi:protein-S-isoprenylcysteine O-methyltransferase Ste14